MVDHPNAYERPEKSFVSVTLHQESLDTLAARGFDKECIAFTRASGGATLATASGGATATGGATASSGATLNWRQVELL